MGSPMLTGIMTSLRTLWKSLSNFPPAQTYPQLLSKATRPWFTSCRLLYFHLPVSFPYQMPGNHPQCNCLGTRSLVPNHKTLLSSGGTCPYPKPLACFLNAMLHHLLSNVHSLFDEQEHHVRDQKEAAVTQDLFH